RLAGKVAQALQPTDERTQSGAVAQAFQPASSSSGIPQSGKPAPLLESPRRGSSPLFGRQSRPRVLTAGIVGKNPPAVPPPGGRPLHAMAINRITRPSAARACRALSPQHRPPEGYRYAFHSS